jgi:hypothetical protein
MKKVIAAVASASLLAAAVSTPALAANPASVTLTPSSASYTQSNNFSVQIHENGDNVNVTTIKLAYDASKLTCNGVSTGSAFANAITATCGGGSVTLSNYATPGTAVNGNAVVGTVNFTANATGTTAVSVAPGTQVAGNGSNVWDGAANSATFTVIAPVVAQTTKPAATSRPTAVTPAATTPQVASATTEQSAVAKTENKAAVTPKNNATINTQATANESSAALVWTTGSIAVVVVALTGAYFWLTRRRPELVKSIYKRVHL